MLTQRFQGYQEQLKILIEQDGLTETNIREAIELGLSALAQDEFEVKSFSPEQIWFLVKVSIDKQSKIIQKLQQSKQKQMELNQERRMKGQQSEEEENDPILEQEEQEEQEIEESQELQEEQQDNQQQDEEDEDKQSGEMEEEYEDYMNQIDEKGYDVDMDEEDDEEEQSMEAQNSQNEEIDQSGQQNQQEESEDDNEMDVESEEEAANIFQSMAYGINKANKEKIEKKLIQPKDWYLKGEVLGNQRSKEQLIDQKVDFDVGMKSTMEITKEINMSYEDILRQIILDKTFDD